MSAPTTPFAVQEEGAWRLSSSVELRPEPFGALAYDFHSRRLSFLKSPALVAVVRALSGCSSVAEALDSAEVPDAQRPAYVAALQDLAAGGLIKERAA
ncbi:mycofactocin biosynthesis chaperone MftB [Nocardioides sp.]|uniref:mycofactocin biosynthesis chaperone MftB n=1 Tax=Nocardioides sp. TaxID=35761 RepID=UPI0027341DD0|nr:mycofactocin biosynthesis chaperone MftB [Nocardioides sp.]MDP3894258.1 mycofactocin biosynthesis chaperone MftB [Nocardioides sp.]